MDVLRQAGFDEEVFPNLEALSQELNQWCQDHRVNPLSGQAAETLTIRTLRYYRSLGLLDAPHKGRKYGRRHFLQLTALRSLQAKGIPLQKIRGLMEGKSDAALHELVRSATSGGLEELPSLGPFHRLESLEVIGLTKDFALLCRNRVRPKPEIARRLAGILSAASSREPPPSPPKQKPTEEPAPLSEGLFDEGTG